MTAKVGNDMDGGPVYEPQCGGCGAADEDSTINCCSMSPSTQYRFRQLCQQSGNNGQI
jgi:hypothetical protein